MERARQYKTNSFAASFWQVSPPPPALAALYEQAGLGSRRPRFQARLQLLLQSTAVGLTETLAPHDE
jgi:hypothetical protein